MNLWLGELSLIEVKNFPRMTIQIKKTALVHKSVVFGRTVLNPTSGQGFLHELINFSAIGNAERHEGWRACMGISHRLGREARKE